MSDKSSTLLFKVVGVLNLVIGMIYGLIVLLTLFTSLISKLAEAGAADYGYLLEPISAGETILLTVMLAVIALLHLVSGIGFLKMKKWQPMVFTTLIILGVLELVFKIVSTGFEASLFLTMFFQAIWLLVVLLVWSKKKLFTN